MPNMTYFRYDKFHYRCENMVNTSNLFHSLKVKIQNTL